MSAVPWPTARPLVTLAFFKTFNAALDELAWYWSTPTKKGPTNILSLESSLMAEFKAMPPAMKPSVLYEMFRLVARREKISDYVRGCLVREVAELHDRLLHVDELREKLNSYFPEENGEEQRVGYGQMFRENLLGFPSLTLLILEQERYGGVEKGGFLDRVYKTMVPGFYLQLIFNTLKGVEDCRPSAVQLIRTAALDQYPEMVVSRL